MSRSMPRRPRLARRARFNAGEDKVKSVDQLLEKMAKLSEMTVERGAAPAEAAKAARELTALRIKLEQAKLLDKQKIKDDARLAKRKSQAEKEGSELLNTPEYQDVLPECAERPDLCVLPITPVLLKRYLNAVTLWLAETRPISGLIELSGSFDEAVQKLSQGVQFRFKSGTIVPIRLPIETAKKVVALNLKSLKGASWEALRTQHVEPGQERKNDAGGVLALPSFGIYSQLLGSVGTPEALNSSFGLTRPGASGAESLQDMVIRWGNSTQLGGVPGVAGGEYATYYMAPVGRQGAPVVLIISGSTDSKGGYALLPPQPGKPPRAVWEDLIPLAEAIAMSLPSGPARQICFLLPPNIISGYGRRMTEVTKNAAYQRILAGAGGAQRAPTPLLDFPWYIQRMQRTASAKLNDRFQQLRQLYAQWQSGAEATSSLPVRAGQVNEPPLAFGMERPYSSVKGYYGDLSPVQAWPGMYITAVLHYLQQGLTRDDISELMSAMDIEVGDTVKHTTGVSLLDVYRKAESIEPEDAESEFQEIETLLTRPLQPAKGQRTIRLSDLPWHSRVQVKLRQVLEESQAAYGMFIPTSIKIESKTQVAPPWPPDRLGQAQMQLIRLGYDRVWFDDESEKWRKILPPVTLEAYLINRQEAEREIPRLQPESSEDSPKQPTIADIRALLKQQCIDIDGNETWYVGIGPAFVEQRDHPEGGYYTGYSAGKYNIPEVLRSLLRVDIQQEGRNHRFVAVPGESDAPWTSRGVPYLLESLPYSVKASGRREGAEEDEFDTLWVSLPALSEDRDEVKLYKKILASSFRSPSASSVVKEGRRAVYEGRESEGSSARRVGRGIHRVEGGRVATRGPYRSSGIYALVGRILQGRKSVRTGWDKKSTYALLHTAMKANWPEILMTINNRRLDTGKALLPVDTMPPLPGSDAYKAELEVEALEAMERLIHTPTPKALALTLSGTRLFHPTQNRLGGQSDQLSELLDPEIQNALYAVENPGRGGRRARQPRRPRRERRARRNPLSDAEWEQVQQWAKTGVAPEDPDALNLRGPKSNEALITGVGAFFPPTANIARLATPERFRELRVKGGELFSRFSSLEPNEEKEALLREYLAKPSSLSKGMPEEVSSYAANRAQLSAVEGRELALVRAASKRKSSIVSPSGAACRLARNTTQLKWPEAPSVLKAAGTAWIVIGTPVEGQTVTRIMSFRNGTHVDCDVLVAPDKPMSLHLGRVIQSMVLWLAEKPSRMERIRFVGLAQVGSQKYRLLWVRGQLLEADSMLKAAYAEEPAVEARLSHGHAAYVKAQKKALRGSYEAAPLPRAAQGATPPAWPPVPPEEAESVASLPDEWDEG